MHYSVVDRLVFDKMHSQGHWRPWFVFLNLLQRMTP